MSRQVAGGGSPVKIFDMLLAYKTTAILSAAIELGVFDVLGATPVDATAVAERLGLAERGARLLLNGLAALGLVDTEAGTYRLGEDTARFLVRGRPGYVGDMARVMASSWEWEAFGRLPDAVRQGGPVVTEDAETPGYAYWEEFAAYAGAVATPTANLVARTLQPWAAARDRLDVLDVACGHGLYGYTLAQAQPHGRVWSLDWPNVLVQARKHADGMGVADRVQTIAGDMFTAPLGGPYDVVMVTNVLHHFSVERCVELLRRMAASMTADGRLVLVGFLTHDAQEPAVDAAAHLFSLLMLVWTRDGEVHSDVTYGQILHAAGFGPPEVHHVPGLPLAVMVSSRGREQACG